MKNSKTGIWEAFRKMGDIGDYRMIADTGDCVVIRVENETGEGDMIIHQVFEGVYLMYNDFHMSYYESAYQTAETVLAVDFCREGSLMLEGNNGVCQVKKSGDVCLDTRVHHKGIVRFPTNHFHGITIGFENELAEKTLMEQVAGIPVDITAIREKFCKSKGCFFIRENETLRRLFTDLYHVPERAKQSYFRTKILELLVCISAMEIEDVDKEKTYFYKDKIEKTAAAKRLLEEDIRRDFSIEELANRFHISQTALKSCFKNMYGKPIHTWFMEYRMQRAAEMLMGKEDMSIGDVAFAVGYESAGKFAGVFKRVMGMTPKEYRNQPH